MSFLRVRRWLKGLPAKLNGSAVDVGSEHVTRLSSCAPFPADTKLADRITSARRIEKPKVKRKTPESPYLQKLRAAAQDDLIGQKLIEDQPDYGDLELKRPIG